MRSINALTISLLAVVMPGNVAAQRVGRVAVDHVSIAVHSLDSARATYRALGFTLKPGRVHANGLRNAFPKFADGSYLELISPGRGAVDALTADYAAFLKRGEGGAFLSIRTDFLARLARRLEAGGHRPRRSEYRAFSTLGFDRRALDWLFFIEYNAPASDAPELLRHANTALGIETVWLSRAAEATLGTLDLPLGQVRAGSSIFDRLATPVVGVTIRVRSLDAAAQAVRRGLGIQPPTRTDVRGRAIVVPAARAHGVWIEFLQLHGG
jgi:hypothetical protein